MLQNRFLNLKEVVLASAVVFVLFGLSPGAQASDAETLRQLQEAVTLMCRGVLDQGSSTSYVVEGDVDGRSIIFKGLVGVSGNAKAKLTHREWEGIENALEKDYVECVKVMFPMLLQNFVKG